MTPKGLLDQILGLPVEERLQLVEDIWDSIAATPEAVPVPDWHKRVLDERERQIEAGKATFSDWETAKERIAKRIS